MALTLRIKSKKGQDVLKNLTLESTIDDLCKNVSGITEIPPETLRILKDFPPKPLDLSNGLSSLLDHKFQSGDVLIVEEDPTAKSKREAAVNEQVLQTLVAQEDHGLGGVLLREVVPANNSCLFTSIHFVMEGKLDLEIATDMRMFIASMVMSDPETYSEAFLGKTNAEYCEWIMNTESWGGAIEVSILSQYYKKEIAVVDTLNVIVNKFGEDKNYKERVFLIYDGIHYDPLKLDPMDGSAATTKFLTSNEAMLREALQLAAEAKASRQFTDVSKFTLRCLVCQKALTGQTEAQSHAKETNHINFGEY